MAPEPSVMIFLIVLSTMKALRKDVGSILGFVDEKENFFLPATLLP